MSRFRWCTSTPVEMPELIDYRDRLAEMALDSSSARTARALAAAWAGRGPRTLLPGDEDRARTDHREAHGRPDLVPADEEAPGKGSYFLIARKHGNDFPTSHRNCGSIQDTFPAGLMARAPLFDWTS